VTKKAKKESNNHLVASGGRLEEKMKVVGRDYIFKRLSQEYFESVFDLRKKYYSIGEPQWLGKNSTIFFTMKNTPTRDYDIVGQAKPTFAGKLIPSSKDEIKFPEEHKWRYVIELRTTKVLKANSGAPGLLVKDSRETLQPETVRNSIDSRGSSFCKGENRSIFFLKENA
jgi:hypothetical protein